MATGCDPRSLDPVGLPMGVRMRNWKREKTGDAQNLLPVRATSGHGYVRTVPLPVTWLCHFRSKGHTKADSAHLRRSDEEQPVVMWPEVTSVTCPVRKYVLRMCNRKLRTIRIENHGYVFWRADSYFNISFGKVTSLWYIWSNKYGSWSNMFYKKCIA
jgi:hypothetical protein